MKKPKPINIISLFSGYDSPLLALYNLHIPYHLICWCETDFYAIKAHNILHPTLTELNIGDIQVAQPPSGEVDMLFYSPPCQDFSKAGQRKGGAKGSGTRSSLLWEVERFIKKTSPRLLLMENVPTLATVHKRDLDNWLSTLQKLGYQSMPYTINAIHCGVPQDRKRLFVASTRHTPPLLMFPIRITRSPLSYLDHTPAPKHLYVDTLKIPTKEDLDSDHYPYILGYTHVYDDPAKSHYHKKKTFNTITTKNAITRSNLVVESAKMVRRLSTSERLRLMGLNDNQIESLRGGISDTQLDKLAGNSICIPVLELIFQQLLQNYYDEAAQHTANEL